MINIRPGTERGQTRLDWLDSRHSFSFADYYDPAHMGFRSLRVINDDRVGPGGGFGMHPHRDMEIITYLLEGSLEHRDSLGTGSVIQPGEVQRMSAGTGIRHSEFNPSGKTPVRLLQIWLLPEKQGLKPSYEQKSFPANGDGLRLLASRDGRDDAVTIHQDVDLFAGRLTAGSKIHHALKPGRHAWIQVTKGEILLNGHRLKDGDGAALSDEPSVEIAAANSAEFLLFDLA
ncbi:MAG TPA: pirin family protein [Gemmataceae bacterium]|nr:pirin family protein [Gemmataceae bacterium]